MKINKILVRLWSSLFVNIMFVYITPTTILEICLQVDSKVKLQCLSVTQEEITIIVSRTLDISPLYKSKQNIS